MDADEAPAIPLDAINGFIETYKAIDTKIREMTEVREAVRREIQTALGEYEVGTVKGCKAVRCKRYTQHRLSVSAVRKKFTPEDLADCYVDTEQTRLTII